MKHFEHVALILLSVAFVYIFSYSTSPRYDFLGGDSAVFQVIGKYWSQGVLPYVELFDQKGPLIFLINALGYMIYPREGVMVPQIVCMYLSMLFMWRALGLYLSGKSRLAAMALAMIYYGAHYWEGNNPGEYTLPLLMASTYFFMRYLADGKNFCPPLYGFIYGLSVGACVMIRATNAMSACCCAFLTAIFLIRDGAFKNLRQNFLSFCAGVTVSILPFVIYFAAHGALYEMLYGTILFNVQYATQGQVDYPIFQRLAACVIELMPAVLTIFFGAMSILRNVNKKLAMCAIFFAVMISALLMNLRLYNHYYMIVVPLLPLTFAVLKQPLNLRGLTVFVTALYAMLCCLTYFFICASYFSPEYPKIYNEIYRQESQGIRRLERLIPDAEKNSFACWGNFFSTSHWILETDMRPRERFFMNNSALSLLDPAQKSEWLQHVETDPPLWILYGTNNKPKKHYDLDNHRDDPDVEQLLADKYDLRGETAIYDQVMKLYRLRD